MAENVFVQSLKNRIRAMNTLWERAASDLTADQMNHHEREGVLPMAETIATGEYGISRPLFFYVKNAHRGVIQGLQEFIEEYVSEAAMGPVKAGARDSATAATCGTAAAGDGIAG